MEECATFILRSCYESTPGTAGTHRGNTSPSAGPLMPTTLNRNSRLFLGSAVSVIIITALRHDECVRQDRNVNEAHARNPNHGTRVEQRFTALTCGRRSEAKSTLLRNDANVK